MGIPDESQPMGFAVQYKAIWFLNRFLITDYRLSSYSLTVTVFTSV